MHTLPFPKKTWAKLRPETVAHRRQALEVWLQHLAHDSELAVEVCNFVGLPLSDQEAKIVDPTAVLVFQFVFRVHFDDKKKGTALQAFESAFFVQHRVIRADLASYLFTEGLVPLAALPVIGTKAIHVIHKLLSPDTNRGYAVCQQAFCRCSSAIVASMQLDLHILHQIHGQGADAALDLLQVWVQHGQDLAAAVSLMQLNGNPAAVTAFRNWNNPPVVETQQLPIHTKTDWVVLNWELPQGMQVHYRYRNRQLEFSSCFTICGEATVFKNLLTDPMLRPHWDLYLQSMEEEEEDRLGKWLLFTYEIDRVTIQCHLHAIIGENSIEMQAPDQSACTTLFIEQGSHGMIDCSWRCKFNCTASQLLRADILGESFVVQESLCQLLALAEGRARTPALQYKRDSVLYSWQRKNLSMH